MLPTDDILATTGFILYSNNFNEDYHFFKLLQEKYPTSCIISNDWFDPDEPKQKHQKPSEQMSSLLKIIENNNVYGLAAIQSKYAAMQQDIAYYLTNGYELDDKQQKYIANLLPTGHISNGLLIPIEEFNNPNIRRPQVSMASRPQYNKLHLSHPISNLLVPEKLVGSYGMGSDQFVELDENNFIKKTYNYYEIIDQLDERMCYMIAYQLFYSYDLLCFSNLPDTDWLQQFLYEFNAYNFTIGGLVLLQWLEIIKQFDWAFIPNLPDWDHGSENLFICRDSTVVETLKELAKQSGNSFKEGVTIKDFWLSREEIKTIKNK